jgi:hypothetical protein
VAPPGEWHVLIKDRLPAYISWERYENNLRRLEDNRAVSAERSSEHPATVSAPELTRRTTLL